MRRRRASDMLMALSQALADPAHAGRLAAAYPRTEVRLRDRWTADQTQPSDGEQPSEER